MDYRTSKRSSISFGSYQRPVEQFQNAGGAGIHQRQSPLLYNARSNLEQQFHSACYYENNCPLFALDWSVDDRVAVGSYKEDSFNKLSILETTSDLLHWDSTYQASAIYPISKIQWMPKSGTRLATCSDSLRIWSADGGLEEQINLSLVKYGKNMGDISNPRTLGQLPPVASFDWNTVDTNIILSSSIDTTCTIWDLQASNYVKTQLIAHDSEVFDAKFLTQSSNLFASCGGDGSVRVFDLRFLAHSTIIYEPQRQAQTQTPSQVQAPLLGQTQDNQQRANNGQQYRAKASSAGSSIPGIENYALLRLAPSPFDANILATIQQDSNVIIILDMRYPGSPILTLDGHMSAINQIQWHPSKPNILISCGDDCQILYWDIMDWVNGSPIPSATPQRWSSSNSVHSLDAPQMSYTAQYEINNLVWRPKGDWIGYVAGKHFRNLKV